MDEFAIFYSVINDEMYKLVFLTFFTMGLRCGELQGLQFRDLDFENKKLSVDRSINYRGKGGGFITNPPKANSYRTIDMPDILVEPLKRWCDYHKQVFGYNDKRYVFGFEKPLHHNSITKRKDGYTKEAQQLALYQNIKLERIRLHDFRHSHITMLLKNIEGIDQIRLVSERAGHKNVSETLDTYGHVLKRVEFDLVSSYNHLKQDFLIPQVDVYKKMLETKKEHNSSLPQVSNYTKTLHLEKSIFDDEIDYSNEDEKNIVNTKIENKL